MSASLAWHGRLFRDTRFILASQLEANDSTNLGVVQMLNNPIDIFLINPNMTL